MRSWIGRGLGGLMLAGVTLSLSGCGGCGTCGPVPCPSVIEGTENNIKADIVYRNDQDHSDDPVVASVGAPGDFYVQLLPVDPSAGHSWEAAEWSQYLGFDVVGGDLDQHLASALINTNPCTLDTARWPDQTNKINHTWIGSMQWKVGTYTLIAKVDDRATDLIANLPQCSSYDDDAAQIKVRVHVWDAIVTGTQVLERGQSGTYQCIFRNLPLRFVESCNWTSSETEVTPFVL